MSSRVLDKYGIAWNAIPKNKDQKILPDCKVRVCLKREVVDCAET